MARLPGYKRTGVVSVRELRKSGGVPSPARLRKGPVVLVECVEKIPCNPCAYACPRNAITIDGELTDLPKVDFDSCNGCRLCIAKCPGLAIFVVDHGFSRTHAAVTMPYEMLPRPVKGQRVAGLDRSGRRVCSAKVVRVLDTKAMDRCAVVTVAVPKKFWNRVRSIRVPKEG
ncbi:MAG: 4Fe-4S binding protein [candidate division WOR-3 bacterium]|nr:MAG: 4Fe-4S binding protein [candidate division WOR-3 bacterium]